MREKKWYVDLESENVGRQAISTKVKVGLVCSVHGVDYTAVFFLSLCVCVCVFINCT